MTSVAHLTVSYPHSLLGKINIWGNMDAFVISRGLQSDIFREKVTGVTLYAVSHQSTNYFSFHLFWM